MIVVKMVIYLIRGVNLLLEDLPGWQSNFFLSFFTPEYLFALLILFTTWIFSQTFANDIDELHNRIEDAAWDEIGLVQNNLKAIRSRLIDQTFYLGGAVIFMAIIAKADLSNLQQIRFDASIPVANAVAFFVFGLLLLAQTQFALLQTRWVWEKIPVIPGLSQTWIRYSVVFFVLIGILVFFLPTDYSVGLLDVLRFMILLVWQIITGIIFLITLFFSYLISLLMGRSEVVNPEPAQVLPPVIPETIPQTPIAWLEYLKSMLFWIVLIGIIGYALINYIRQNAALLDMVKRIPIINLLFRGLTGFLFGCQNLTRKSSPN